MGVTEDDGIDATRVNRKVRVEAAGLAPPSLKEPGVEQNAGTGGLEQMHRAGNLTCAAVEGDPGHEE
jgi:hypothetical protein